MRTHLILHRILIFLLFVLITTSSANAQNTVGLITNNSSQTFKGYNLIYPHNQSNVYLLNECGEIVHRWEDEPHFRPGNSAYITKEGFLYKTKRPSEVPGSYITGGGAGGIIEIRDWDNNLIWSTTIMDSLKRAHHDIAPMPNGNVLIVSWESKSLDDLVLAGRDTATFIERELWPDYVVEFDPVNDSMVWEWHAWDHLIQDYDSSKMNFGVVEEHPELINLNYDLMGLGGRPDWMHVNALDYHPVHDQILINVPFFNEIWIIDHSTSTEEAKGHTGGKSGKGGDLLYRWGNPQTYNRGNQDDQQLFFQHDAHWNDDFLSTDHQYFGSIALFNNRVGDNFSTVNILSPTFNGQSNNYELLNDVFLPENFELIIYHPDTFPLFSSGLSGVQFLDNNNALITVGRSGYAFEITQNEDIVWEYILPLRDGVNIAQGESVDLNSNTLFRLNRYPIDFSAFEDRDLIPQGYIELMPNEDFCGELSTSTTEIGLTNNFQIFPNPTDGRFIVERRPEIQGNYLIQLVTINGSLVKNHLMKSTQQSVIFQGIDAGIYMVRIVNEKGELRKVTKVIIL